VTRIQRYKREGFPPGEDSLGEDNALESAPSAFQGIVELVDRRNSHRS
jgi:hypothetical protein